jgi:hypothetical protein
MPDFWLDSNSFIEPKKGPDGFDIAPGFWAFLEQKAAEGVIASSITVFHELEDVEDDLLQWARQQRDKGFFKEPDALVQTGFRQIADFVNKSYPQHQASYFLSKADPWIIAHAMAYKGRVVTLETASPISKRPKIPDVANQFDVKCLNIYQMVRELGMSL